MPVSSWNRSGHNLLFSSAKASSASLPSTVSIQACTALQLLCQIPGGQQKHAGPMLQAAHQSLLDDIVCFDPAVNDVCKGMPLSMAPACSHLMLRQIGPLPCDACTTSSSVHQLFTKEGLA